MSWFGSLTRKTASKSQNTNISNTSANGVRRSAIRVNTNLMDHVGRREEND